MNKTIWLLALSTSFVALMFVPTNIYAPVFTEAVDVSPGRFSVFAGFLPAGTEAVLFQKPHDAVNSVRYTFTDVGGTTSDAGGAAYWRGYMLQAPDLTINSNLKLPRFVTYAEYDTLTDPTQRLWVIDAGNSNGVNEKHDIVYRIAQVDIMYLDDSGNVGFGTSTPSSKLDVAGDIRLTGNIVSPNDICIGNCP